MLRQRRRAQAVRKVPDRALLDVLQSALPVDVAGGTSGLTRIANACFAAYNVVLRRIVRW